MSSDEPTEPDRRARLKARTRLAIVDAAAALMAADGPDFSVDELAVRADVARRTVFNHFDSLDDVVAAVGARSFEAIVDALLQSEPDPGASLQDDAAGAVRRADLVGPMAALSRGFGLVQPDLATGAPTCVADTADVPPRAAMLLLRSLAELNDRFVDELLLRHPGRERLDADLAVAALLSDLVVLHRYWLAATAGATDAASRATWSALLDRLRPRTAPPSTPDSSTPDSSTPRPRPHGGS
ncbi:TetR/AcrR family transcriptional regulator [Cellulomonas sp. PhB143]|uniref:TetR/AcrR family transcriptional regulator n=1 Tax=Cellulomonas sp. PhB143 TaxID=2485186 RepID=UPI000F47E889|nr:TetR family transcriptional regulator [Cellulomonas sp. PhB143]ROS75433.1 TetR family transcriptional regulator [Cellulomonas sp. PhB143]